MTRSKNGCQGGDCTTSCLLHYNYFNEYHKIIGIDLSKQQAFDPDTKAIQQIEFPGNLNRGEEINDITTMLFIIDEVKETILDFSQGLVRVL